MLKPFNLKIIIPVIIISSTIAATLSTYQNPTIGASAIVMSMMGLITSGLKKVPQRKVIMLVVFSFITTFFFAPHVNTLIHVYSFSISFVTGLLLKRKIYVASKRYNKNK